MNNNRTVTEECKLVTRRTYTYLENHPAPAIAQQSDLINYKGIYFDDDKEKYSCPITGAHFEFQDVCRRLKTI